MFMCIARWFKMLKVASVSLSTPTSTQNKWTRSGLFGGGGGGGGRNDSYLSAGFAVVRSNFHK
jgi:hypothetical protein